MSEATKSEAKLSLATCTQCNAGIKLEDALASRHAVPCGHVVCGACTAKVEALITASKHASCALPGCDEAFRRPASWVPAWCARRTGRIAAQAALALADQGNVGDSSPPPLKLCVECDPDPATGERHAATHECKDCGDDTIFCAIIAAAHPRLRASKGHVVTPLDGPAPAAAAASVVTPRWSICADHNEDICCCEVGTMRLLCVGCLNPSAVPLQVESLRAAAKTLESVVAAQKVSEAVQQCSGDGNIPAADVFRIWGDAEIAKVRAAESAEIRAVQEQSASCVDHISVVVSRWENTRTRFLLQRRGLCATLEEIEDELKGPKESDDSPTGQAAASRIGAASPARAAPGSRNHPSKTLVAHFLGRASRAQFGYCC